MRLEINDVFLDPRLDGGAPTRIRTKTRASTRRRRRCVGALETGSAAYWEIG
ncbi:hypothetical protein [Mycobacterium asiaticum]|uniref:hypothetical protein n=1 Tax=Mycobacterium asiaticum TaxID=1790 RepID=UPI000AD871D5|nr:hypothetical protein [Mycobacterium asiaticum]